MPAFATLFFRVIVTANCLLFLTEVGCAAEPVEVITAEQLQEIGLTGLTPISDEQGLGVRGSGIGRVAGLSFSVNLSGLIPSFSIDRYASTRFGTSLAYSFPGTLLGLLFGGSSGGTANFGQGGSSAQ